MILIHDVDAIDAGEIEPAARKSENAPNLQSIDSAQFTDAGRPRPGHPSDCRKHVSCGSEEPFAESPSRR